MNVPQAVSASFEGEPTSGELDAAALFVTADTTAIPMVCLLSRRQIRANNENVAVLIRSRRTLRNLETSRKAILHVIADNAAWTLHLELQSIAAPRTDGAVPVNLIIGDVEEDRVAKVLEPARYLATDELIAQEGPSITTN